MGGREEKREMERRGGGRLWAEVCIVTKGITQIGVTQGVLIGKLKVSRLEFQEVTQ